MQDSYQIPALVLTLLLLPTFAHLYHRHRDTRTLLWLLAYIFVVIRMCLLYPTSAWEMWDSKQPWAAAVGQGCAMLASGLFLGSLSPLSFRVGKLRVLYAIPYTIPLVVYAILSYGPLHRQAPQGALYWLLPGLAGLSVLIGLFWGKAKGTLPT